MHDMLVKYITIFFFFFINSVQKVKSKDQFIDNKLNSIKSLKLHYFWNLMCLKCNLKNIMIHLINLLYKLHLRSFEPTLSI